MLTPEQTWSKISEHLAQPSPVDHPCAEILGYVLAEPVRADRDSPPADRSAMDGFAVRAADLANAPVTLTTIGEIAAGSPTAPVVLPNTCARLFTGANLPPGADTVVKLEDTQESVPGQITCRRCERSGANVLRRGENAGIGSELLPAGTRLGAGAVGLCAAVGLTRVQVFRKPTTTIVTTGRELCDSADPVGPHQERDSNGPMLAAGFAAAGFEVISCQRVSDERAAVAHAVRAALRAADVVVTTGGVSVGAYDFVPDALADVGAEVVLHGVAMKPGKPFLFARAKDGKVVFGLPGNPLSAATGLHEFILPALRQMSGWPTPDCRPLLRARLRSTIRNRPGRQRHLLAALAWTSTGPEAVPTGSHSSADLVAGVRADGTIIVPPNVAELAAGAFVDFRPWRSWP